MNRRTMDARKVVDIGGCQFVRNGATWLFWCGCGDLVELDDVHHDHCPNCWVTCSKCEVNQ